MGVQGFTPFLQKTAPHIIHKLPNRLKDLAGKKIVIDGTLITQRLHFAPSPHPFRHVLGWYNLAKELNDNNIRAVCIFDGNTRTKAKALELGRREASRKLHLSRNTLEAVRIKRLQTLQSVMANVRSLDEKGKSAVAEMLARLNVNHGTGTVGAIEGLHRVGETLRVLSCAESPSIEERPVEPEQKKEPKQEKEQEREQEQEQEQVVIPTMSLTREEYHVEEQEAAVPLEAELDTVDPSPVQEQPQDSKVIGRRTSKLEAPEPVPSPEDIKSVILNSYRDFRSSISKVTSLPLPEKKPKVSALMTFDPTEEMDSQEEDLVLSKTQYELTLEEGKVWDELTLATAVVKPAPIPEVPPTPPPAEVPLPTVEPSITTSSEPLPTSPPLETHPTDTLPPAAPTPLEAPSPAFEEPSPPSEAETEALPAAPIPESPIPHPEAPSPPPEAETETPTTDLPTAPASLETPPPAEPISPSPEVPFPPETPLSEPEAEIETPPATTIPTSLETPLSPPETEIEVSSTPTTTPAFLEQPSPLSETPSTDALSIPTPTAPVAVVEEPEPEPPSFTFDHLVLSAAEDRLHALASRSETIADSYQRRTILPTKATYMEAREILEAMGVRCYEVQGEHEGEGVASSLVLQGMADYVVSEDTDVLVYGAPIIRNVTSQSNPLVMIHGSDVREALELSKDAFIDFAILMGTDFSQRIKNVGPMRALKLIKEYETIENILNGQTKHQPTIPHAQYMAQVNSARAIFGSLPPIPSQLRLLATSTETIDQAKVAVVMERCGLGRALVAGSLWDFEAALDGNYFSDNPSMIVS